MSNFSTNVRPLYKSETCKKIQIKLADKHKLIMKFFNFISLNFTEIKLINNIWMTIKIKIYPKVNKKLNKVSSCIKDLEGWKNKIKFIKKKLTYNFNEFELRLISVDIVLIHSKFTKLVK